MVLVFGGVDNTDSGYIPQIAQRHTNTHMKPQVPHCSLTHLRHMHDMLSNKGGSCLAMFGCSSDSGHDQNSTMGNLHPGLPALVAVMVLF